MAKKAKGKGYSKGEAHKPIMAKGGDAKAMPWNKKKGKK